MRPSGLQIDIVIFLHREPRCAAVLSGSRVCHHLFGVIRIRRHCRHGVTTSSLPLGTVVNTLLVSFPFVRSCLRTTSENADT